MGPSPADAETGPVGSIRKYRQPVLYLGYGNGAFGANFNAGLAAKALVNIDGIGFAVHQFENLSRTSVYALLVAGTLIYIHFNLKHN
jgi:hypothetical protein